MGLGSWLSGKVFLLLRVRQSNFPRSFVTRIFSLHQEAGQGRGGRVGCRVGHSRVLVTVGPRTG